MGIHKCSITVMILLETYFTLCGLTHEVKQITLLLFLKLSHVRLFNAQLIIRHICI